ncbi:MAG: hypothetical protein ACTSR3_16970, partial [Candidatus Helarchaeota archaeon]
MEINELILFLFTEFEGTDTGWILICTCLVFIMTPGLAFFYGGLLRKKNMISMMQCVLPKDLQNAPDFRRGMNAKKICFFQFSISLLGLKNFLV